MLGAAGGIGQPMSMLLKMEGAIKHLSLFDVVNTPGVAADLSHINTPAKVRRRAAARLGVAAAGGARACAPRPHLSAPR